MAGRRLTPYYAVLVAAVSIVTLIVLSIGQDTEPQRAIAGGYAVAQGQSCLGTQIQLNQSGQFVSLDREDGSRAGKLRFRDGSLTGDVTCTNGASRSLRARVRGGTIAGRVGREPVRAAFVRDPPDPSSQKPTPPPAIDGDYKFVPRSVCLGGTAELHGPSNALELEGSGTSGELVYTDDGRIRGTVECANGAE